MNRAEKKDLVTSLNGSFGGAEAVIITHYKGLSVAEITSLRSKVRGSGASIKIAKNKLVKRALEGTEFESLSGLLSGPTAITFSKDPVSAAKTIVSFAKENEKLVIIGGALGKQPLAANDVKALAELPSLDEIRAKLLALINTPATRLATLLQAPASQVARVISAHADKNK